MARLRKIYPLRPYAKQVRRLLKNARACGLVDVKYKNIRFMIERELDLAADALEPGARMSVRDRKELGVLGGFFACQEAIRLDSKNRIMRRIRKEWQPRRSAPIRSRRRSEAKK